MSARDPRVKDREQIIDFLNRMANSPKWRDMADTDEIRHFVGHAEDYIRDGAFTTAYTSPEDAPEDPRALKAPRLTLEQANKILHIRRFGIGLDDFILTLRELGIEVDSAPPEVKV